MRGIQQAVQGVVHRIYRGETVPVKKEYQNIVADELDSHAVPYCITEDKTNLDRLLFRRTTERPCTVHGEV